MEMVLSLFKGRFDDERVARAADELVAGKIAKGLGGQVELDAQWVTIRRKGLMAKSTHGFAGNKRIPIANITSVQLKMPGLANGYIQFAVLGGTENRGGIVDATKDENSIMFTRNHVAEFVAIKNHIEDRIAGGAMRGAPAAVAAVDVADQLTKLAALRDSGVLSAEEFDTQKAKLLA